MTGSDTTGLRFEVQQTHPMPLAGHLTCPPGQMLGLVGPSGAGKTSVLRAMAGLMRPAQGRLGLGDAVWWDSATGLFLKAQARHVGLVFQHYALMPHLSAQANVALALGHLPGPQRAGVAHDWLRRMGLNGAEAARRPAELSGGQQQRVALARALAREPQLLLLDEPFSAVDQMSREALYRLLADLRRDLRIPILLVTHDLNEARRLCDQIAVMDAGRVLQQGDPLKIQRAPRNARVADLVGIQNRFRGQWLGPDPAQPGHGLMRWLPDASGVPTPLGHTTDGKLLCVADKGRIAPGQAVHWVMPSDGLLCLPQVQDPATDHPARVVELRHLGDTSWLLVELLSGTRSRLHLTLSGPQRLDFEVGAELAVRLDLALVHVMPTRENPS